MAVSPQVTLGAECGIRNARCPCNRSFLELDVTGVTHDQATSIILFLSLLRRISPQTSKPKSSYFRGQPNPSFAFHVKPLMLRFSKHYAHIFDVFSARCVVPMPRWMRWSLTVRKNVGSSVEKHKDDIA